MRGTCAKEIRKILRYIQERSEGKAYSTISPDFTKSQGRMDTNNDGETVFFAPITFQYPSNHIRTVYKHLKKEYKKRSHEEAIHNRTRSS